MTSKRPIPVRKSKTTTTRQVLRRESPASSGDVGLQSPILGKNFKIPDLYSELAAIELDDTLPYVPIYCHFILPEIQAVVRPKTPPILTKLRAELEEMQLTKSTKTKPEQRSRNTHHNHRQSNKNH